MSFTGVTNAQWSLMDLVPSQQVSNMHSFACNRKLPGLRPRLNLHYAQEGWGGWGGGATRCQHILDQSLHLHSKWWPSLVIFLNWRWSKWIWRCQLSLYFLNYRISRRKHILILQKCTKYAISTFHWICPNVFHPVWSVWPDWADLLDFGKLFKACGNN